MEGKILTLKESNTAVIDQLPNLKSHTEPTGTSIYKDNGLLRLTESLSNVLNNVSCHIVRGGSTGNIGRRSAERNLCSALGSGRGASVGKRRSDRLGRRSRVRWRLTIKLAHLTNIPEST